jgi:hypothetical protein
MVTSRISVTGVAIIVALTCAAPFAWADREGDRGERRGQQDVQEPRGETPREGPRAVQPRETHKAPARSAETPQQRKVSSGEGHPAPAPGPQPVLPREARRPGPPPHPGYVLDKRYGHNHYYPPRGYAVPVLPRDYRVVHYHGSPYYYHSGIWYRPYGSRFVVVVPPFGIVVPILPPFYTTIWWGGIPYYYAGGVYYTWYPDYRGYVVTEPPPEAQVQQEAVVSDELYIYPKKGQSEKQQALDRYECHRWSSSQTGFDPTQPGGGVSETQNAAKRSDYRRAMTACLEARGYSVQ